MSLAFRLGTVAFTMAMMALALYILTAGILGRKIHWKSLGIFFVCAEALQWAAMLLYLLYTVATGQENMPSAVFDTVCYLLAALVLGALMTKVHRIPLLYTFTAAILCTFVVNTANTTMVYVVEEYSPLFDRQHFLAFVRLDVPYMLTVGVALLVAAILKRSEFYRYFAAMFRSRARGVLTLAVCLALMFILPLQQLLFPDLTPNASYATFFFALIVAGVFLLQFAAMYAAGQDRIKAQEETILQQQSHMALLEELQQEIRAFRHDFTNLFSGLTLQAQEGDLAGIQDFMKRTSSYFDEKLGSEIAQMDGLNNIQLYPLRSLLATKLAKMRQMRIKGVLEAMKPVNGQLGMDTDDLLRALGILLDNAIEAVPKGEGQVRVVLLQEEKELYLAVANNYEKAPDLSALTKKGYTTKGSGHGTGLTSYRRIVSRCRGCAARTYLKDGMFIQELHIPAA
ncbi:MAG TPA: GHKL domain-containing protein [Candidatus Choladousia intestinavium]|uniref:GHKL domain-containing protein n=1 Tax=Candidatus Choladousia intestinavium TaxID=2840727 RepID=A0A9D1ABI3_9FIRM|nr:GHKL domain-containing protein [Candidatus Choladousia intestinavium]